MVPPFVVDFSSHSSFGCSKLKEHLIRSIQLSFICFYFVMAHAKNPSVSALMEMISQLMPELDEKKHKGEAGMIGVIGGSEE